MELEALKEITPYCGTNYEIGSKGVTINTFVYSGISWVKSSSRGNVPADVLEDNL